MDLEPFPLSLSAVENIPVQYHQARDYVREIGGSIGTTEQPASSGQEQKQHHIGTFETRLVQIVLAKANGFSTFDVLRSLDNELAEYAVLFDDSGEFRDDIVQPSGAGGGDLLVLHRIYIHEEWRGNDIGLRVAARQILTFARGCYLVALKPFPVTGPGTNAPEWQRPLRGGNLQYHAEIGIRNLGRYWGRLGFTEDQAGIWILAPGALQISPDAFRLDRA